MQRDMDLVRQILLQVADSQEAVSGVSFVSENVPLSVVAYHIEIMQQAGLIE
jgi:hypothetical protein